MQFLVRIAEHLFNLYLELGVLLEDLDYKVVAIVILSVVEVILQGWLELL